MDYTGLILIGGFVAFMYMFIIRPQQQRQKQMREMYEALVPGDRIITIGGLHGELTKVDDTTVTVRVANDLELVFQKTAVGETVSEDAEDDN